MTQKQVVALSCYQNQVIYLIFLKITRNNSQSKKYTCGERFAFYFCHCALYSQFITQYSRLLTPQYLSYFQILVDADAALQFTIHCQGLFFENCDRLTGVCYWHGRFSLILFLRFYHKQGQRLVNQSSCQHCWLRHQA